MVSDTGKLSNAPEPTAAPPLWQRFKRWLFPLFGLLVFGLLASNAHKVDWSGAWTALKGYPPLLLLTALGMALASHALYGCFDLIGASYTQHGVARWRTWAITVTSYAFNLNLGSLVGSVAMRARLYSRAGVDPSTVAQIVGLSMATNWLGYCLLAGGLFGSGAVTLPDEAHLGAGALRILGAALIVVALGYVAACAWSRGREWQVRGRRLHLPTLRLAVIQLTVSTTNWALMGAVMYLLLGDVPYVMVLGTLMAAAIAGVAAPIPAGLGVLEAVYLALLGDRVGQSKLLGAVLAYRAIYYLLPMAIALVLYLLLERYASKHVPRQRLQSAS